MGGKSWKNILVKNLGERTLMEEYLGEDFGGRKLIQEYVGGKSWRKILEEEKDWNKFSNKYVCCCQVTGFLFDKY